MPLTSMNWWSTLGSPTLQVRTCTYMSIHCTSGTCTMYIHTRLYTPHQVHIHTLTTHSGYTSINRLHTRVNTSRVNACMLLLLQVVNYIYIHIRTCTYYIHPIPENKPYRRNVDAVIERFNKVSSDNETREREREGGREGGSCAFA